jgi:hypothetical protein
MYFFEGDSARALKLATASSTRPQHKLTRNPIATPAVVGAIIEIDRLFDLTTQSGIENFSLAAEIMVKAYEVDGKSRPRISLPLRATRKSSPGLRPRSVQDGSCLAQACKYRGDCSGGADFSIAGVECERFTSVDHSQMKQLEEATLQIVNTAPFQASRGAFEQGKQVDPSSAIFDDTHLQLAVHDLSSIKGWFLCPGDKLLTPDEFSAAEDALNAAKALRTAQKPRTRAS